MEVVRLPEATKVAPSRERGLKQLIYRNGVHQILGRSFTGAWIETSPTVAFLNPMLSRSFTGAWIETICDRMRETGGIMSLLHGSVD